MKKIRIAGAQIPVGTDIQINKKEIFKAIDWAKENEVDCLLTPEGSLSGYESGWQGKMPELNEALIEVEKHQRDCGVGLHLGTGFQEREINGQIYRNEIRHYNKDGALTAITNKAFTLDSEGVLGRIDCLETIVSFPLVIPQVQGIGLICNDMWGAHNRDRPSIQHYVNALLQIRDEIQIIFHSTNGRKIHSEDIMHKIYWDWHNSVLRLNACYTFPILTVDSCTQWDWDGDEEWVDKFPTSSQSGFVDYSGWLTDVPRYGRQYFYYDLDPSLRITKFNEQNKQTSPY